MIIPLDKTLQVQQKLHCGLGNFCANTKKNQLHKLQTVLKILFKNCPKINSKATKTPIEKISNGGGEHYTLEKFLLKKVPIRYGNFKTPAPVISFLLV